MTHQEKMFEELKKGIEEGPAKKPLTFINPYAWSPDGINVLYFERGKTYTKYMDGLYDALQKETIPRATYDGKVIEPYENKLMAPPENKNDILSKYLDGLNVSALRAMCNSKSIDTKGKSKQNLIESLMAVK